MNIKLLPFDVAVKKAKEQGGFVAKFSDNTQIVGIEKKNWVMLENKVLTVHKETYYYAGCDFSFPKCCCEVIEK